MAGRGVLRTIGNHGLAFHCPGCGHAHAFYVHGSSYQHIWEWNGEYERPTFRPSLLMHGERWVPPVTHENYEQWQRAPWPQQKVEWVCHLFVTDGKIQFLGDCSHELRGQTIAMQREDEMDEREQAKQELHEKHEQHEPDHQPENPAVKFAEQAERAAEKHAPVVRDEADLSQVAGHFIVRDATLEHVRAMTEAGIPFEALPVVHEEDLVKPEPEAVVSPLKETAGGTILDRLRRHITAFEHALALEEHELATEAYDAARDAWDELRGHFQRR